jgi:CheY-like chemotaxis protein
VGPPARKALRELLRGSGYWDVAVARTAWRRAGSPPVFTLGNRSGGIRLPAGVASIEMETSTAGSDGTRAGRRVLVVDDDDDVATLTAEFLEFLDEDVQVETATDPAAALAGRDLDRFDCIVSDYHMPGMNGLELYRTVRDRAGDVPVVLFSSIDPDRNALDAETSSEALALVRKGGRVGQFERLAESVDELAGRPMTPA